MATEEWLASSTMKARRHAVEIWMRKAIFEGGIARYSDLHLDDIDSAWANRKTWIGASVQAMQIASDVRREHSWSVTIALVMSLKATPISAGVDFSNSIELERNLGHAPPSLYLFEHGQEPWNRDAQEIGFRTELPLSLLGSGNRISLTKFLYYEFRPYGEDLYSRNVVLVA